LEKLNPALLPALLSVAFRQIRISQGRQVFVIRWNAGGVFQIVKFEPGDWERTLKVLASRT
jgi:hypothetical protein